LEAISKRKGVASRAISVAPLSLQGRPAVLYIDAPRGAPKPPIDATQIALAL